jgi:hypothetical protein
MRWLKILLIALVSSYVCAYGILGYSSDKRSVTGSLSVNPLHRSAGEREFTCQVVATIGKPTNLALFVGNVRNITITHH